MFRLKCKRIFVSFV